MDKIKSFLTANIDEKYANFQRKIIPNIPKEKILGVRTPILRKFAKTLIKENAYEDFLSSLPHETFEENQLHSFILCELKDFDLCLRKVDEFLPFVDNWATCDQLAPKIFKKNHEKLLFYSKSKEERDSSFLKAKDFSRKSPIIKWLNSKEPFTIRFGIEILMNFFLDELKIKHDSANIDDVEFDNGYFDSNHLDLVTKVRSSDYYVKMMVAWYFATAPAKRWRHAIKFLDDYKLSPWIHQKTIQKACESNRLSKNEKEYLRLLKTTPIFKYQIIPCDVFRNNLLMIFENGEVLYGKYHRLGAFQNEKLFDYKRKKLEKPTLEKVKNIIRKNKILLKTDLEDPPEFFVLDGHSNSIFLSNKKSQNYFHIGHLDIYPKINLTNKPNTERLLNVVCEIIEILKENGIPSEYASL